MKPKFETTQRGIEIIDPIERHRYHLETSEPLSLESVSTDRIRFPIGAAVEFRTDVIALPTTNRAYVRDSEDEMFTEVRSNEQAEFPRDEYTLDLSGPIKIYAQVDSEVHIYSDGEKTYVSLDDESTVILGARSFHKRPAGTIITTEKPADLMEAVSMFSSALKTTSPERSYPTLRGHPPRLKPGSELHIPDTFKGVETEIQIEIPPTLQHTFVVTPLAYYLGADLIPGPNPRLETNNGYSYPLNDENGFEAAVERVLKQVFFLDCVIRTEGTTPLPLHERKVIESSLEFDFKKVYSQSLDDRLETYLDVPYDTIEPHLSDWELETRVESSPDYIEFLPFIANDLAIVKIENETSEVSLSESAAEQAIESFTRNDFVRSSRSSTVRGNEATAVSADQPQKPTIQQSWSGLDRSEIVSTTSLAAYENSIGRTPKDGPLEIKVVCNDLEMREELETVNGTYGAREELPFDITVYYDLSIVELKEVLASESDFLHYIGHIDEDGFQCTDGKLDAEIIDTVGAKAFLLNACQSHDQGRYLVNAGSIGGIVTLGNIVNSGAVSVGSQIARLMNFGFPLYGALDIARQENIVGQQYLIVGDGRTTIAQSETRTPNICSITGERKSGMNIELMLYTPAAIRKGGVFSPDISGVDSYYVLPRVTNTISVSRSQVRDFLAEAAFPVLYNGNVHWSNELLENGF